MKISPFFLKYSSAKIINDLNQYKDNIFIAMNGPGTENINWDTLNEMNPSPLIILTNSGLANIPIKKNIKYILLVNDPIVAYGSILLLHSSYNEAKFRESIRSIFPYITKKEIDLIINQDLISTKLALNHENVVLAIKNKKIENFSNSKEIIWLQDSFLFKLFYRFAYTHTKDDVVPKTFLKKYGFRTKPYSSRFFKFFIKKFDNEKLSRLWYLINRVQYPSTFYTAIDLAVSFECKNLTFSGFNSDISDWLIAEKNNNKYEIPYKYFFGEIFDPLYFSDKSSIIREILLSLEYLQMVADVFKINIINYNKENIYSDFW